MHLPEMDPGQLLLSLISMSVPLAVLAGLWLKVRQIRRNELHGLAESITALGKELNKKFDEKVSKLHEKINETRTDLDGEVRKLAVKVGRIEGLLNQRGTPPPP